MTPTERKELFAQAKMLNKATIYLYDKGIIDANSSGEVHLRRSAFYALLNKGKAQRSDHDKAYIQLSFTHDGLTYFCLVPRKVGK